MPDKGTILKLKNYNRSKSVPFAVYLVIGSFIKSLSKALIVRQAVIRISQMNNKSINHVGYFASMISSINPTQEVGRNTRLRLVFLPTLLSCSSRLLRAL